MIYLTTSPTGRRITQRWKMWGNYGCFSPFFLFFFCTILQSPTMIISHDTIHIRNETKSSRHQWTSNFSRWSFLVRIVPRRQPKCTQCYSTGIGWVYFSVFSTKKVKNTKYVFWDFPKLSIVRFVRKKSKNCRRIAKERWNSTTAWLSLRLQRRGLLRRKRPRAVNEVIQWSWDNVINFFLPIFDFETVLKTNIICSCPLEMYPLNVNSYKCFKSG